MRNFLTRFTSLCFAITLLTLSAVTASAEENNAESTTALKINGDASANIGEVVTYSLYLADASDPIVGFELRLFYDSEYLEYQQGSLHFDKFDVVIYNEGIPGKIPMNCSQFNNPSDFSKKSQFVSASFKVLKPGNANITYFFTELYGDNMSFLSTFTFSYNLIAGDDKVLVKDKNPPVNQSADVVDRYAGDFPNYEDGMGDNYLSANRSEQHEVLVEENGTLVPYVKSYVQEITSPTATGDSIGWFQRNHWVLYAGIGLAVAAVVAAVIVAVKKGKSEDQLTQIDK